MVAFSWFILKVLIVSGILTGYYFLALKDKTFHKWNRFYLLFTIVLSLCLPFISIDISAPAAEPGTAIKVLQAVTMQDEIIIEMSQKNSYLNTNNLIISGYIFISFILFAALLKTLFRIIRIKRNFPNSEVEGINFINTNDKSTPFSFFNSIFWNRSIDLHSQRGQQIFSHEVVHVRQKHTHDKVFLNVVLLFFWINPFFWIIRKELNMIHEFVADKMSLEDGDTNAFAEMILSSVYPNEQFSITNNFFYSPIKRRLHMIMKNKNSKVSYAGRLLVLPLAAIIFFAFTFKIKKTEIGLVYTGKPITVVIDAGHGGEDGGAKEENINEKDLTLAIAQQVKELNDNKSIKILLTRSSDEFISPKDRTQFALANNADLYISIHLDVSNIKNQVKFSGLNVSIPKNDNRFFSESRLLGSAIMEEFKKNYTLSVRNELSQPHLTIYGLKENQYPAIVINPASISVENDLAYISKPENQRIVAENILRGIENYAQNNFVTTESQSAPDSDTIPAMSYKGKKVTGMKVKTSSSVIEVQYADGTKETITKEEADKRGFILPPPPPPPPAPNPYKPFKAPVAPSAPSAPPLPAPPAPPIPPTPPAPLSIDSIDANSNKKKVVAGIVQIINESGYKTNDQQVNPTDTFPKRIFTKVEQEAQFPGGPAKWAQYIQGKIFENINNLSEKDYGTCVVRFIVDETGNVSEVKATTMQGTGLAKVSVDAIRNGPKWIPAMQNNRTVNAYRLQPVTLTNPKK